MVADPLTTGGVIVVSLGAFKIISALIDKIGTKKGASNGKAPAGYYATMLNLAEVHMGPAALDAKSGTPRWWGNRSVTVLEEILKEIKEGGDAKLRQEVLRFLQSAETSSTELAEKYVMSLNAQTEVLQRLAQRYDSCEYCQDSARHLGDETK